MVKAARALRSRPSTFRSGDGGAMGTRAPRNVQAAARRLAQRSVLASVVALITLFSGAAASAQVTAGSEARSSPLPFRLDAHATLDWEGGFGAGARADIPFFDKQRMYNGRDELAISVGA